MTEKENNKRIKEKCRQCRKGLDAWLNGLDPDTEKTEEMRNHVYSFCPACRLIDQQ